METPPSIEKYKSEIRKRGTHMDRHNKKTAANRSKMTQQFDIYDLYYVFEDDGFKFQGIRYGDNYFRVVPAMLQRNKRRIQSTGDII